VTRYTTLRPRAENDVDELQTGQGSTMTVIEAEDDRPQPTGLYDASGTPLYRVRERLPMGFAR
jgi:hypothetical protein